LNVACARDPTSTEQIQLIHRGESGESVFTRPHRSFEMLLFPLPPCVHISPQFPKSLMEEEIRLLHVMYTEIIQAESSLHSSLRNTTPKLSDCRTFPRISSRSSVVFE
jgi:hypothetical protein